MTARIKQKFTACVVHLGDQYVSQCYEMYVASQGTSEAESLSNLVAALEYYCEIPTPKTLDSHGIDISVVYSC